MTIGEVSFTLSTEEVDAIIRRLLELRPLLLPETKPDPQPPIGTPQISMFSYLVTPNHQQSGAYLHLTTPATGWVTWAMVPHTCRELIRQLQDSTVPPFPAPLPSSSG